MTSASGGGKRPGGWTTTTAPTMSRMQLATILPPWWGCDGSGVATMVGGVVEVEWHHGGWRGHLRLILVPKMTLERSRVQMGSVKIIVIASPGQ